MTARYNTRRRLTGLQVLEELYALPSDDDDSDTEIDEGSKEELLCLESSTQQPSTSLSTSVHTDADLDEEAMDSDYDDNGSNSESEDDDLWSNAISKHFENLHPVSSSNPEVTALMNSTDNARSYFDTIFDADICAHIVEKTNLYIAQKIGETGRNSQNFEFAVEDLYAWIGLLILLHSEELPVPKPQEKLTVTEEEEPMGAGVDNCDGADDVMQNPSFEANGCLLNHTYWTRAI